MSLPLLPGTLEKRVTQGLIAYCAVVFVIRMVPSFLPYVAETDWKQWIWQYHRFHTSGAFPAGNVVTDYGMIMQPPAFFAVMAALSFVFPPVFAAILVNAVAFLGALWAAGSLVAARTRPLFGAAAAALLARDDLFHRITCGGYPRSFGPTLTLLVLALWMRRKHRAVLAVLILEAALYPSVVVPSGLAYGAWCVLLSGRAGWLRRNLELVAATVPVAALALLQNLRAEPWWGPVVRLPEAITMPALGPQGRFTWLPLGGYWPKVLSYLEQPFGQSGLVATFLPWPQKWVALAFVVVTIGAALALVVRARLAGKPSPIPCEPPIFFLAALLAFLAARVLAFELYLPHRMVQHTVPYLMVVFFVLVVAAAAEAWAPASRATGAALGVMGALFLVSGDGLAALSLRSYAQDKELYTWIDAHTPIDAQVAGNLQILDEVPLFARRAVFVNWKMAHPVRRGYYAEMERRIVEMYGAYYATDLNDVLAFCDKEKIALFIVDHTRFDAVEKGDGQLFEPVRGEVVRIFDARKARGFALRELPPELVAFHHRVYDVIDVAKLRAWLKEHPATGAPPTGPAQTP